MDDSSYNSTSEAEADSDPEQDPDDPEKLLNDWLGELDTLTGGLDTTGTNVFRPFTSHLNTPRIDSYRFSMANLEESQDVELDAILGELCALETQYTQEVARVTAQNSNKRTSVPGSGTGQYQHQVSHSRSNSEGQRVKLDTQDAADHQIPRTDSPDNDSAFSDNVSMLSSESSASSGGSGGRTDVQKPPSLNLDSTGQMDAAARAKAEKIRIALEKMREASVKKLFIKAFSGDGSSKSLLVDEKMSCGHVARLLADKNHVAMEPRWAIVEHLPELHMERVYEDHELLVENLMMWTRDSKNRLLFLERPEKCKLFLSPEVFLLNQDDRISDFSDDHSRSLLLEEFFSNSAIRLPEVEGPLYLKSDSKKGWKKYHFVLRASGLYYWPKEKAKTSRDLTHLTSFDVNQVYYGVGWRKKYKAPTDYCFAIKHPRLQQPKSTKFIKFLCTEDEDSLHRWVTAIRIVKFGRQLMDNYRSLMDDITQEDLDILAHARSCSVSSIAPPARTPDHCITQTSDAPSSLRRRDSSSSSGCMSDEVGFECEFPSGTIKRKPSMNPKLPLTSITRQLKEVGETVVDEGRQSRRRSCATPSGSEDSGTLKRYHHRGSLDSTLRPSSTSSSNASTPVREQESSQSKSFNGKPDSPPEKRLPSPPDYTNVEPDSLPLPPPPLDMFESTLSLDSLPPPPPLSELPVYTDLGGSSLSLVSLPPPPSPCIDSTTLTRQSQRMPTPPNSSGASTPTNAMSPTRTCFSPPPCSPLIPPKPRQISLSRQPSFDRSSSQYSQQGSFSRQSSSDMNVSPGSLLRQVTNDANHLHFVNQAPLTRQPSYESTNSSNYTAPPYLAELKAGSPMLSRKAFAEAKSPLSPPPLTPKSPILLTKQRTRTVPKKISFAPEPEDIPTSPTSATRSLPLGKKPLPPKRSDSTRLTSNSPRKLSDADSTLTPPPKDFLKDLQRVMKKKWQVAQKCKLDTSKTPHEVLGFRDPPPPDYRETNVSNWVQEHYGHRDNLYENVYLVGQGPCVQPPSPPIQEVVYRQAQQAHSVAMAIAAKKRPPPPPPKRSETTQLSSARLH